MSAEAVRRGDRARLPLSRRARAALGGLPGAFWTLWCGIVVSRVATFVSPMLAVYLVRDRGFAPAAAGRVVSLYGLGVVLSGLLGGMLADRLGRRPTLLLGLGISATCVAALAVARQPWLLAALTFLCAAGGEMPRPAANAAIADVVAPADRARAWGLVYWGVNLGLAVGLLLAGLVAERSIPALFFADSATTLLFAALVFARLPETRPAGLVPSPALAGLSVVFRDRTYVAFLLLYLASLVVFTQWLFGLPLDMAAHGLGPSSFSVLMGLNCLGVVVLQPLAGTWLRARPPTALLVASSLLFGAGYGVNAIGGGLPLYALGTACWTVGEVVGLPMAAAIVADLAPVELRGRYQGVFSMAWGIAFTLSPLLAGELITRLGARALWLACLGISALVALGYVLTDGPRRERIAAAHARSATAAVGAMSTSRSDPEKRTAP